MFRTNMRPPIHVCMPNIIIKLHTVTEIKTDKNTSHCLFTVRKQKNNRQRGSAYFF